MLTKAARKAIANVGLRPMRASQRAETEHSQSGSNIHGNRGVAAPAREAAADDAAQLIADFRQFFWQVIARTGLCFDQASRCSARVRSPLARAASRSVLVNLSGHRPPLHEADQIERVKADRPQANHARTSQKQSQERVLPQRRLSKQSAVRAELCR